MSIDLRAGVSVAAVLPPTPALAPVIAPVTVVTGGGAGSAGVEIAVSAPAGTWTVPVPAEFAVRRPDVTVLDDAGSIVLADVTVSGGWITVVFASPATGFLLLS